MKKKIIKHEDKLWELAYSADPECVGVMTKASYQKKDMVVNSLSDSWTRRRKRPYWL